MVKSKTTAQLFELPDQGTLFEFRRQIPRDNSRDLWILSAKTVILASAVLSQYICVMDDDKRHQMGIAELCNAIARS